MTQLSQVSIISMTVYPHAAPPNDTLEASKNALVRLILTRRGRTRNKWQVMWQMWGKRQKLTERERRGLRETGTTAGIGSAVMTRACLCNCLPLPKACEREGGKRATL